MLKQMRVKISICVFIIALLTVFTWIGVAEPAKTPEYLYYVDVNPAKMAEWLKQVKPDSPLISQMDYFVKYGKQYDVNPVLLLAIAGVETSFATDGIHCGYPHKAPFNIGYSTGLSWRTSSQSGRWCGYAKCKDYEDSIHDVAYLLGCKYLHPKDKIANIGGSYYDTGGGSNPTELDDHRGSTFVSGGVMGASKEFGTGNTPNITGLGLIYCEVPISDSKPNKRVNFPQWNKTGWPGGVKKFYDQCSQYAGVLSVTRVCLDPVGSELSKKIDFVDPATKLSVDDLEAPLPANLQTALATKKILEDRGYDVVLTRTADDQYLNYRQRADIGNDCDLVVRIDSDERYKGITYPSPYGWVADPMGRRVEMFDPAGDDSFVLANTLAGSLKTYSIDQVDTETSENESENCNTATVLYRVPVVTVRGGYVPPDQVASGIAEGLSTYLGAPAYRDQKSLGEKVVEVANSQIGKPFAWDAKGPDMFNCSGLVDYCYMKAGYPYFYGSPEKASFKRYDTDNMVNDALKGRGIGYFYVVAEGDGIMGAQILPGDVIGGRGFCSIYAGNNEVILSASGRGVIKSSLATFIDYNRQANRYLYIIRVDTK